MDNSDILTKDNLLRWTQQSKSASFSFDVEDRWHTSAHKAPQLRIGRNGSVRSGSSGSTLSSASDLKNDTWNHTFGSFNSDKARGAATLELESEVVAYNFKPNFKPGLWPRIDENDEVKGVPSKPAGPPPLPPDAVPVANKLTLQYAGIEAGNMKTGRGTRVEQLSLSKRNLKERMRRARQAAMKPHKLPKIEEEEEAMYLPRPNREKRPQWEGPMEHLLEGPCIAIGVFLSISMCLIVFVVLKLHYD